MEPATKNVCSRRVTSNQSEAHRDLVSVVRKHQRTIFQRPIAHHSQISFERTDRIVKDHRGPVMLDSGCGNGESSQALARDYPAHLVIGIDKSTARIKQADRHGPMANLHFVRGECIDFWRLALAAKWPVERHFLLYPNPWPKAKHLRRRWHGHAVFKSLIALGGLLELRSNWAIYVAEFSAALTTLGFENSGPQVYLPIDPMSAFERKYLANRHQLYRLSAALGSTARERRIDRL